MQRYSFLGNIETGFKLFNESKKCITDACVEGSADSKILKEKTQVVNYYGNKQQSFLCFAFTYVYVDSLNEYKLCSDAELSSKINTNDMSILEYFNSDYLNELRFDMLRGVLTDEIKGMH